MDDRSQVGRGSVDILDEHAAAPTVPGSIAAAIGPERGKIGS
jgi:hypothetical protein